MDQHLDEDVLGLYALDPKLVTARRILEEHLSECAECRDNLNAIRRFDEALRDSDTWLEPTAPPNEAAVEELREFSTRMAEEDVAATSLLAPFEHPEAADRFARLLTTFVWTDPSSKPLYRTGGVVRRLCRLANGMCEQKPLYALTLSESATAIASVLSPAEYPRDTIHELRGMAWKEQANALHHLGRLNDALGALSNAETEYRKLRHTGLGLVAVSYVRAAVLYEQEQYESAEKLAGDAAAAAIHLGATDYHMRARHLLGEIRYERQQYGEAAEIFGSILAYGEARHDRVWIARESLTVGNCCIELQNLDSAGRHLARARSLFAELGYGAEILRADWAIARLHFSRGEPDVAIHKLRTVVSGLSSEGMLTDSAIASVDLAEMFYVTGRIREIPRLLAGVVKTFTEAGKLTAALNALAYLKDATATPGVEPRLFAHVKKFIARADHQTGLLFAPPA